MFLVYNIRTSIKTQVLVVPKDGVQISLQDLVCDSTYRWLNTIVPLFFSLTKFKFSFSECFCKRRIMGVAGSPKRPCPLYNREIKDSHEFTDSQIAVPRVNTVLHYQWRHSKATIQRRYREMVNLSFFFVTPSCQNTPHSVSALHPTQSQQDILLSREKACHYIASSSCIMFKLVEMHWRYAFFIQYASVISLLPCQ